MLGTAIRIAASVHEIQLDKGGKDYILHPLRVMMRLRSDDEELNCIAVLHDVIEDSDTVDYGYLREQGMSNRVIDALVCLTRLGTETYDQFIGRCASNIDAVIVKMEDLRDNSDITRLKGLRQKDFERVKKYQKAYDFLESIKKTHTWIGFYNAIK